MPPLLLRLKYNLILILFSLSVITCTGPCRSGMALPSSPSSCRIISLLTYTNQSINKLLLLPTFSCNVVRVSQSLQSVLLTVNYSEESPSERYAFSGNKSVQRKNKYPASALGRVVFDIFFYVFAGCLRLLKVSRDKIKKEQRKEKHLFNSSEKTI